MQRLKNNWQWKLVSLVIGFFLWSYVMGEVNPSQTMTMRDVKIEVFNEDQLKSSGYVLSDIQPARVSVTVTGKRNVLANTQTSNIRAYIDINDLRDRIEGSRMFTVHFKTPDGVIVSSSSTDHLTALLEKVITRETPVKVETTGTLDDRMILSSAIADPQSIQLTGPRSLVDRVTHLRASVDVSGLEKDRQTNVTVEPVDKDGNKVEGLTMSSSSANVALIVLKTKEVKVNVVLTGKSPQGIAVRRVQVNPDTMLVKGKSDTIDQLEMVNTEPIDRATIRSDAEISADLDYPNGVAAVDSERKVTVSVDIERASEQTIQLKASQIEKRNLAPGMKADWTSPDAMVTVTIVGFPSDFDNLDKSKIKAYVDLGNYSGGKYKPDIAVNVPEAFTVKSVVPQSLEIEITETASSSAASAGD